MVFNNNNKILCSHSAQNPALNTSFCLVLTNALRLIFAFETWIHRSWEDRVCPQYVQGHQPGELFQGSQLQSLCPQVLCHMCPKGLDRSHDLTLKSKLCWELTHVCQTPVTKAWGPGSPSTNSTYPVSCCTVTFQLAVLCDKTPRLSGLKQNQFIIAHEPMGWLGSSKSLVLGTQLGLEGTRWPHSHAWGLDAGC